MAVTTTSDKGHGGEARGKVEEEEVAAAGAADDDEALSATFEEGSRQTTGSESPFTLTFEL